LDVNNKIVNENIIESLSLVDFSNLNQLQGHNTIQGGNIVGSESLKFNKNPVINNFNLNNSTYNNYNNFQGSYNNTHSYKQYQADIDMLFDSSLLTNQSDQTNNQIKVDQEGLKNQKNHFDFVNDLMKAKK